MKLKTAKDNRNYVTELLGQLSEDQLTLVDFDRLRQWLGEIGSVLAEQAERQQGAALLREDYVARIGGMVKAIAAANSGTDRLQQALAYLETLSTMSEAELVEQYRRVSAAFRDTFPASFASSLGGRKRSNRLKDPSVFK